MKSRNPTLGALILLLPAAAAGCVAAEPTGSVAVEIQTLPAGHSDEPFEVNIFDADGERLTSYEFSSGSSYAVEGLSLGWTTVELTSLCEVSGELTAENRSMTLILDGEDCQLTD